MKYIVYETTNLVNNKIYIGVHKTKNPEIFDGYIGCGVSLSEPSMYMNPHTPFQYAVRKYGTANFKRKVLKVFDTLEDALKLENELVNIDFIKRKDTYNIAIGGNYGTYLFPVNQFDIKGNLIKTWDNMALAAEALGVSHTSINLAKLYKGSCLEYFWSTEKSIDIKEYSYKPGTKTYKYTSSGELVAIFSSITEAAKDADCKEKTIYRAIKMNMRRGDFYYSFDLVDKYVPKKCPPLRGKTIYIYTLDGEYITGIESGKKLQEYFNIKSYNCLKQALMTNKPYKGVQVSFEKFDNIGASKEPSNKSKKVGCYDLQNNLLEILDSIHQTTKKYGSGAYNVLRNRQKQFRGLIFKYIE